MALLRMNATRSGALLSAEPGADWRAELAAAIDALPAGAPVTVLLHGYRFTWRDEVGGGCFCPHRRLYRTRARETGHRRPVVAAWPDALGFSAGDPADGLCIALGWDARVSARSLTLAGLRDFRTVYEGAEAAGAALARLAGAVAGMRPGGEIDILAHSLGARVALAGLAERPGLPWGRAVFLGAAERRSAALAALAALETRAAPARIYHVMSRANDLFDALFGWAAPGDAGDRPLGAEGLGRAHPAWLDIQLDHPATMAWLAARGHALTRSAETISHWHFYADPGAMAFYRAVLRRRPGYDLATLAEIGLGRWIAPRWSRLAPALPGLRLPQRGRAPLDAQIAPDITEA